MLNEFLEFEEYTCALKTGFPERMKPGNLARMNNKTCTFTGVKRALTIISRYAYYEEDLPVAQIVYLLNLWCGFQEGFQEEYDIYKLLEKPAFKHVKDWLPTYITKTLSEDTAKTLCEQLKSIKKKSWNQSRLESNKANDYNAIYFDEIIADAIARGPLHNYGLGFEVDLKNSELEKKNKGFYDRDLKLLAAYLLEKPKDSLSSQPDIPAYSNWVVKGCALSKKYRQVVDNFTDTVGTKSSVPVFTTEFLPGTGEQIVVLNLNADWFDFYKPQLVLLDQKETVHPEGLFILRDQGCEKPLVRI